jgi:type II secretion system protein N
MTIRKRPTYIIYFLYACLLTGVLLVVRFPAGTLRHYCTGAMERILPGTTCSIGGINYDFPLTLCMRDIRVTRLHSPEDILVVIKDLWVRAEPRQSGARLLAEAYGGRHECRLQIRGKVLTLADIKIRHLDLGQWGGLQGLLGRKVSGFLDVTGTYMGRWGELMAGEAKGVVAVREGSVELLQPILSLNTLNFQNVETEFHLQNQSVTMAKGNLHGVEFNGTFAGILQLTEPLGSGALGVSGELTPLAPADADPQWKNRASILQTRYKQTTLPFVISGTLAGPLFRFGG